MKILLRVVVFLSILLFFLQINYCINVDKKEVRVGFVDVENIYNVDIKWDNVSFLIKDINDINICNKKLYKLERKYNIKIKNYSTTKIKLQFSYDKYDMQTLSKYYFDKNFFVLNENCEENVSFCEEINFSKVDNKIGTITIKID